MKNAWFILLFPSLVSAHPSHSEIGLVSGILHPFSGIDHMAAMMGVGLVCILAVID
ncbi:HupE/UreJ family protein [Vibrio sp. TBRI6]